MDYRLVKSEEMIQAVSLADLVFRDAQHTSMGATFPHIFHSGISHSYGAFDGDRLVSFMGFVPFNIKVGSACIQVFSMGAVCTTPEYRGQGISSTLLQKCKQHAEEAGASLIFISGDRSLYTRADCYHFGRIAEFTFGESEIQLLEHKLVGVKANPGPDVGKTDRIQSFMPIHTFALHNTAKRREVAYEHSVADLLQLIDSAALASCSKNNHETLVAVGRNGSIEAFCVFAADLNRIGKNAPKVIEWAGPAEAVAELLLHAVHRFNLTNLELTVGWHDEQIIRYLADAGLTSKSKQNMGTIYIVNVERLLEQASPYLLDRQKELTGSIQANKELPDLLTMVKGLSPRELVSILFDPEAADGKSTGVGLLPIPLPNTAGLNFI